MKRCFLSKKKLEDNLICVTLPDEITVTFDSLFGMENVKETLQDIVNYFSCDAPNFQPHTSYCIVGPLGTGKMSLVFATAKSSNVPVISMDTSIFVSCELNEIEEKFALIFKTAEKLKKKYKGCIIAFRNIDETDEAEDSNSFYLNLIKHFDKTENIFVFALSGAPNWIVPSQVLEKDFFTTVLAIEYPDLNTREKIFENCISKAKIRLNPDVSINRLAKDTLGETPLSISYIVKEAHLYSLRQKHETVTLNDFSETIMKMSAGAKRKKMTEKEREFTAYHEAGHVIAGYFSNPEEYVLKRVEISPRQESLGLTCTDEDEDKLTKFQKDYEHDVIHCFGGMCAEEIIFGSHTSGVVSDLAQATATVANMVRAYGMGTSISPMVIIPDVTASPHACALVEDEIIATLRKLYKETKMVIAKNLPYLHALAKALLEKETLLGSEVKEIFEKVKIDSQVLDEPEIIANDDIVK